MNTTELAPLPARPGLEQYKKQAKEFVKLGKSGDAEIVQRVKKYHPHPGSPSAKFALADAQLVIAREHGFESWPKFVKHIEALPRENSPVSQFELAADAVVPGAAAALESLLRENPKLVRPRSPRVHVAPHLHSVGPHG